MVQTGRGQPSWAGQERVAKPSECHIGLLSSGKFVHSAFVFSFKKQVMFDFGIHLFFYLFVHCFHNIGFGLKCTIRLY